MVGVRKSCWSLHGLALYLQIWPALCAPSGEDDSLGPTAEGDPGEDAVLPAALSLCPGKAAWNWALFTPCFVFQHVYVHLRAAAVKSQSNCGAK